MSRARTWVASHKLLASVIAIVGAAAVIAAFAGIAQATDQPGFCASACHEMRPYHTAWSSGPHADVSCVSCHVDPGTTARLSHKVVALKEVWISVAGDPSFPLEKPAPVPDSRCLTCHDDIRTASTGFDHASHAEKGDCVSCHAEAGHRVTAGALKAAGVFNENASEKRAVESSAVAAVGAGSANVAGHLPVACANCHDMQATGCASCHEPEHASTGPAQKTAECTTCHSPGQQFAFAHPTDPGACDSCHTPKQTHSFQGACATCHTTPGVAWAFDHNDRADCRNCHKSPAKHRGGPCSTCHKVSKTWAFSHPSSSSSCTSCHNTPAKHRAGSCTTCHKTGASWAFAHPSSGSCTSCHTRPAAHKSGSCTSCHKSRTSWAFSHPSGGSKCTSCHARPAKHSTSSCTSCHKVGSSWAFRHPGSSASCTSCHNRPSGHRSGSCVTCHSTSSWKFRHPGSKSCSSCHNPPSNHYSGSCGSCHSPSRSWSSATFSHPRVPGGEHSYRSFACSSCHPKSYASYSCLKCHDSNSGDDDDD